jgi:hypothetical protein
MDHALPRKFISLDCAEPPSLISIADSRERLEEVSSLRGLRKIDHEEMAHQRLILLSFFCPRSAECGLRSKLVHTAHVFIPRLLG